MTTVKSQMDILEYLKTECGCAYLSDLSSPRCYWKIKDAVRMLDMTQFPLNDWEYAYSYMLGTTKHFDTVDALQRDLLKNLSNV